MGGCPIPTKTSCTSARTDWRRLWAKAKQVYTHTTLSLSRLVLPTARDIRIEFSLDTTVVLFCCLPLVFVFFPFYSPGFFRVGVT